MVIIFSSIAHGDARAMMMTTLYNMVATMYTPAIDLEECSLGLQRTSLILDIHVMVS